MIDAELTELRAIESLLLHGGVAFDDVKNFGDRLEFTRHERAFVLQLREKKTAPMRKFVGIWRQRGGCDYTIGCGIAVRLFEALDLEAARQHLVEQISDLEELSDEVANSIEQVDVYEMIVQPSGNIGVTLTPETWKLRRQQKRAEFERAKADNKERAEYERLKKKFER